MNRKSFLNIVYSANTFLILTHIRPDGDAISSSLAIYDILISLGKKKENIEVFIPHISNDLSFIDKEKILTQKCTMKRHDLVIVVDCSDSLRVEGIELLKGFCSNQCINIDHHAKTGTPIKTMYSFVDTSTASCTCIIYREFSQYISEQNRPSFYRYISIGIMSDTIGLKQNVTEECRYILDFCKSNGINVDEIGEQLKNIDIRTQELANVAIERLFFDRGIGCTYILQSDLIQEDHNLKTVNHKAIIQQVLEYYNCETLILLIENDNNEIKGSIRTTVSTVDLNAICDSMVKCQYFLQGGGHSNSSGFRMAIPDVKTTTLSNIYTHLIDAILA